MKTKIEVRKKSQSLIVLLQLPKFDPSKARKFFNSNSDSKINTTFEKLFDHFKLSNPSLYHNCLELLKQSLTKLLQKDPAYLPGVLPTIFRAFLEKEIRTYENSSWSIVNERFFQDFLVYLVQWNIDAIGSSFEWARRRDQNVLIKYRSEKLPRTYAFLPLKKDCCFDYYRDGWENRLSELAKAFVEAEFDSDKIGELQVRDLVEAVDYFSVQLQFYLPKTTSRKLLPQLIIFLTNFIYSHCRTQKRALTLEDLSEALNAFVCFKIKNSDGVPIKRVGETISYINYRKYSRDYGSFIETALMVRSKLYSKLDSEGKALDNNLVDTLLDA